MQYKTADLRDAAYDFLARVKDFVHSTRGDLYDSANQISKQIADNAPSMSEIRDAAASTLNAAGKELVIVGAHMSDRVRRLERGLLKIGIFYALYELFFASDEAINETARKVKQRINERPVESAAVALVAGVILGKILR